VRRGPDQQSSQRAKCDDLFLALVECAGKFGLSSLRGFFKTGIGHDARDQPCDELVGTTSEGPVYRPFELFQLQ